MNKKHLFLQFLWKNKGKLLLATIATLFFFLYSFCYLSPYKGKVIDVETKKPIEGAVVLVIYFAESPGIAGSNFIQENAQETLTDENGEFNITGKIAWFEKGVWPEGGVTIFKPGYGLFPKHKLSTAVGENRTWPPPRKYVVYELPKLKSFEERKKNVIYARIYDEIPYRKRKLYWKVINQELKNLGLPLNTMTDWERNR